MNPSLNGTSQRRFVSLLVVALGLLLVSSAPGAAARQAKPTPRPKPVTHTVTMDATKFSPTTITLKPGDSIEWVNKDLFPHTATSSIKKDKGSFDSGVILPGKSWKYTPKVVGAFAYVCIFHPTMKGTLTIKK